MMGTPMPEKWKRQWDTKDMLDPKKKKCLNVQAADADAQKPENSHLFQPSHLCVTAQEKSNWLWKQTLT